MKKGKGIDERLTQKVSKDTMVKMSPGGVTDGDIFYENKIKYLRAKESAEVLRGEIPETMGEGDARRVRKIAEKHGLTADTKDLVFQFYILYGGAYRKDGLRFNQLPKINEEEK